MNIPNRFEIKRVAWNKGLTITDPRVAKNAHSQSEETRTKLRLHHNPASNLLKGEESPHWKGDKVGYEGLHAWIYYHFGSAPVCAVNNKECKGRFEWANINAEGKYTHNLDDWTSLCKSHHARHDFKESTREKFRILNTGRKQSAETVEKRVSKLRGRSNKHLFTKEWRKNLSIAAKARHARDYGNV